MPERDPNDPADSSREPPEQDDLPATPRTVARLGNPPPPRTTADELAGSVALEDISPETAQRLIAAAEHHLARTARARSGPGPGEPQAGERSTAPEGAAWPTVADFTLEWEIVRSAPKAGDAASRASGSRAGFRRAGEAPLVFRATVPGGWIYLVDGMPVFVPEPLPG